MADIVLRDRNGNPLNFYGAEYLDAITPDGTEAPYALYDPETLIPENIGEGVKIGDVTGTKPTYEMLENIPVALDFSNGNQTITAPEGSAVKSAIIQQPGTLIPENIAEGINIAGIIGTLAKGKNAVIEKGTFTGANGATTVNHNLGVVPDIVYLYTPTGMADGANQYYIMCCIGMSLAFAKAFGGSYYNIFGQFGITKRSTSSGSESSYAHRGHCIDNTTTSTDKLINNATTTSFVVGNSTNKAKNVSYTWFAIGGLT